MATLREQIVALLAAESTLTALVGTRIYWSYIPAQGGSLPAVTFAVLSTEVSETFDEPAADTGWLVRLKAFGQMTSGFPDVSQAEAVFTAVDLALQDKAADTAQKIRSVRRVEGPEDEFSQPENIPAIAATYRFERG